jgi:ribosomal protein L18E
MHILRYDLLNPELGLLVIATLSKDGGVKMPKKVIKITEHLKKKSKKNKEELRKKIAKKLKEARRELPDG